MAAFKKDLSTTRGGKMSAGHFRVIAEIIRQLPDHAPSLRTQKASTALAFAQGLRKTNPNFKADRFYAACMEGMTLPDCS